ncbi:MAG: menaquinone biosynthetic enzyme MqnA/MqnD family protein [Thermoplasmatota archaeon]
MTPESPNRPARPAANAGAKVGVIDFLNSLPVYLAIDRGVVALPKGMTLVRGEPTELNRRMSEGELAVASVSSIHWARHADELVLLPDLSINSRGFVHSVTLYYKDDISTVADGSICVTGASATSEVLLKILLSKRFGIKAKLFRGTPDLEAIGRSYDAALLIGDAALEASLQYPNMGRRDLGLEWVDFANVPMVFAVWVARKDFASTHPEDLSHILTAFREARRWSDTHRADIVEAARAKSGLPRALLERYFQSLRFDLDEETRRGLETFLSLAAQLGEAPAARVTPWAAPR